MTNSFAVSEQTASMNVARDQMTTTLITTGPDAGKILIAGGNNGIALSSTELYDPVTNTFAPLNQTASMNEPAAGCDGHRGHHRTQCWENFDRGGHE